MRQQFPLGNKIKKELLVIQRRFFSLLEVMIVISIVAVVMAVIGVNVKGMIDHSRFRSDVERVIKKLRIAQELMLIEGKNCRVYFHEAREGLTCTIYADGAVPVLLKSRVNVPQLLKGLERVSFQEHSGKRSEQEIELKFEMGGETMSRGELTLSSQSFKEIIVLPGYPTLLKKGKRLSAELDNEEEQESIYPYEVLQPQ